MGGLGIRIELHCEVLRHGPVVEEVLADHLAAVAETDHEVAKAAEREVAHHVPENRLSADLDHRLGLVLGLFSKPRSLAAAEDDDRAAVSSHGGRILTG